MQIYSLFRVLFQVYKLAASYSDLSPHLLLSGSMWNRTDYHGHTQERVFHAKGFLSNIATVNL